MSPLANWITTQPITAAALNGTVNDLPKMQVNLWTGGVELDFVNLGMTIPTAYPATPQLRHRVAPVVGDYLMASGEIRTDNAAKTIDLSVRLARGGIETTLFTTSVTGATFQHFSGLSAVAALGALGNASCEDVEVLYYFKSPAPAGVLFFARNLFLASGTLASLSSYME